MVAQEKKRGGVKGIRRRGAVPLAVILTGVRAAAGRCFVQPRQIAYTALFPSSLA